MAEPTEHANPAGSRTAAQEHLLVYQPVSLLAVAGLSIAALYAVVVLVGFLASFLFSSPWLMPAWTVIFPLAGITLSLVARLRIQHSEGTLAGVKLTGWGIALSVLFSLIYVAHTLAVYLVLRQQADNFGREFFDELKSGSVEGAMRLVLPPEARPRKDINLRNALEIRFNVPAEASRTGIFNEFQQSDSVRFLVRAGKEADVKFLSVSNWDYVQGGYLVQLNYRVTTPDISFEMLLSVRGAKGTTPGVQGRQWQVQWRESGIRPPTIKLTAQGNDLLSFQGQAQAYFDGWLNALQTGQHEQGYLATLDLSERKKALDVYQDRSQTLLAVTAGALAGDRWAALAILGADQLAWRELALPGYVEFTQGRLVQLDADRFHSLEKKQAEVLAEVRRLFGQPEQLGRFLKREQVRLLQWTRTQDRLVIRQDVQIFLGSATMVDGFVVLECDANASPAGPPVEWRVAALELVRARPIPTGPAQRGP